jgi:hypothetical protein
MAYNKNFSEDKDEGIKLPEGIMEEEDKSVSDVIKIGDEEYKQDELQRLVGLGKLGLEAEEKYKTKIDNVWPEFTKKSQKLKELERENEQLRQAQQQATQPQNTNQGTDDQEVWNNLNKYINDAVSTRLSAHRLVEDCKDLEGKIDGSDGRPKFESQEVLSFMEQEGIKNPERAYKEMHAEAIEFWEREQLSKARPEPLVTEQGSTRGNDIPQDVKITDKNFDAVLKEALGN